LAAEEIRRKGSAVMAQGSFDSTEIQSHATLTQQRADDLQQAIVSLRSAAGQLAAVWTGPGASAFQSAREKWEQALTPLQEALTTMGASLSKVSSVYESNETSIAGAFDA
jgi:WXG100 family type VII secretion target